MLRFLPGYELQIIGGAGLSVTPGKVKVVKHTTETPPGTLQRLITHWSANWGAGLPHFIAEGSRIVQLLPLDVGAYTLENAPGGADTNRSGPAIQMERVRYSKDPMTDEEYEADGKWLADLVKAGVDLDLSQHPRFYGANEGIVLASYNSPIRMTAQQYVEFNGFCGHQHTPENAHWDPGKIDGDRLEQIARRHLGAAKPPHPKPLEDTMVYPFRLDGSDRQYYIDGGRAVPIADTTHRKLLRLTDVIKDHPLSKDGTGCVLITDKNEIAALKAALGI